MSSAEFEIACRLWGAGSESLPPIARKLAEYADGAAQSYLGDSPVDPKGCALEGLACALRTVAKAWEEVFPEGENTDDLGFMLEALADED